MWKFRRMHCNASRAVHMDTSGVHWGIFDVGWTSESNRSWKQWKPSAALHPETGLLEDTQHASVGGELVVLPVFDAIDYEEQFSSNQLAILGVESEVPVVELEIVVAQFLIVELMMNTRSLGLEGTLLPGCLRRKRGHLQLR